MFVKIESITIWSSMAFCLILDQVSGKIFERCELARELLNNQGIDMSQLATWVCIAKHESDYNTEAYNPSTGDYGIFQISHLYWCSPPGQGCGVTCAAMQDDNLSDDTMCIRKIFDETQKISGNGFTAWVTYNEKCYDTSYAQSFLDGCL